MDKSVVIFSAQYPPHVGGIESFTRNLADALANQGHEVLVVTNDTNRAGAGVISEGAFKVMRLPCLSLIDGRLPIPLVSPTRAKLIKQLKQMQFDGVLINARFYPHSLLGMKLASAHRIRPLVLDHGSAYLSFSNRMIDPVVRAYERAITALGKIYHPAYFGISKKSAEWLSEFDITAEGIISNSIDAKAYRDLSSRRDFRTELGIGQGEVMVAFIGRLIPEKGIKSLIEASKSPEISECGTVFVLAGNGPMASDVISNQSDTLRYVGRLNAPDVSSLLQQSNLLCLPTRSEGFSTTLLEASACGCPAIVTDVGGARELIPSSNYGTIIGSMEPQEIVDAVARLASSRDRMMEQSLACRKLVENKYSWDETATRVVEALDEFALS